MLRHTKDCDIRFRLLPWGGDITHIVSLTLGHITLKEWPNPSLSKLCLTLRPSLLKSCPTLKTSLTFSCPTLGRSRGTWYQIKLNDTLTYNINNFNNGIENMACERNVWCLSLWPRLWHFLVKKPLLAVNQ